MFLGMIQPVFVMGVLVVLVIFCSVYEKYLTVEMIAITLYIESILIASYGNN
tara:strand:+ start:1403 stop:1558 length:156 start_codon:yes stop_codon:yes gene_type:complete